MLKKNLPVLLIILIFNFIVGGLCAEYVIEFWGTLIKSQPVDIPFLPCAVVSIFLGEISIPAAAITWLASFIIQGG